MTMLAVSAEAGGRVVESILTDGKKCSLFTNTCSMELKLNATVCTCLQRSGQKQSRPGGGFLSSMDILFKIFIKSMKLLPTIDSYSLLINLLCDKK